MALVSVTLFTACSSDDDAVTPVFPQVKTIGGAAGAELNFTFDANESWSLSSDKIWCKLVQGEKTDAFVLNGTAGKQTIKVKITGDDASDDMSVAQLFLNMGGQKVAIAEVKRSAADHKLHSLFYGKVNAVVLQCGEVVYLVEPDRVDRTVELVVEELRKEFLLLVVELVFVEQANLVYFKLSENRIHRLSVFFRIRFIEFINCFK